jgi:hypothetical protein
MALGHRLKEDTLAGNKRPVFLAAVFLAALIALSWASTESAGVRADPGNGAAGDTIEISDELRNPSNPEALLVNGTQAATATPQGFSAAAAAVGDESDWVALHDAGGFFYLKTFQLRAPTMRAKCGSRPAKDWTPTATRTACLDWTSPPGTAVTTASATS